MKTQVHIIDLFLNNLSADYTIHQISKLTGQSYASTNTTVHQLIKEGILNKKNVGPSILCSLNLQNPATEDLLIMALIQRRHRWLLSSPKILSDARAAASMLTGAVILCIDGKVVVVSDYPTKGQKIKCLGTKEFSTIDREKVIVFSGFEQYLALLKGVSA